MADARPSSARVYFLLSLVVILFFLVLFKLFCTSVLRHKEFKALANKQHQSSFELPSRRGSIFSSDGFPLASTEVSYLLYAEPKKIARKKEVAIKICGVIGNSNAKKCEKEILEKLSPGNFWLVLQKNISEENKDLLTSKGIEGIGFEKEYQRFYPEGKLAAHVLGFVGESSAGSEEGYFGIEGFYDGDLRGRPGRVVEEKDALGNPIIFGEYKRIPPVQGSELTLTLDRAVQYIVEKKLSIGVKRYGAKSGTVIIENPKTGEILALANYPSFDPKKASSGTYKNLEKFRSSAISETYEPGSVVKAMTVSAGLDLGRIEVSTTVFDSGPLVVGDRTVDTWDGKHHGQESVSEVLQNSCNVGAALIAQKIGTPDLRKFFLRFGFGSPLGVDLEGEDTGRIKNVNEWYPIDLAAAAFGQGLSVTPLQLVAAFSALANDGVLMKPYVVSSLSDRGSVSVVKPKSLRRVVSGNTSRKMGDLLTRAVSLGESKYFVLKNYSVAGKTGTAQIPVEGKYDPSLTNATFVGFFPKDRQFVMLVLLKEPKTSPYAAETAVPLWMEIANELASSFGILPDK